MSNLIFNLRIACWHFQIERDWPWFRVSFNDYHKGRLGKGSPWVEWYQ